MKTIASRIRPPLRPRSTELHRLTRRWLTRKNGDMSKMHSLHRIFKAACLPSRKPNVPHIANWCIGLLVSTARWLMRMTSSCSSAGYSHRLPCSPLRCPLSTLREQPASTVRAARMEILNVRLLAPHQPGLSRGHDAGGYRSDAHLSHFAVPP